jgi:hypothetical protein
MNMYSETANSLSARAQTGVRAAFIRSAYLHLALAVLVFVVLETFLLRSAVAPAMLHFIGANKYGWLGILGVFIITGWLARGMAANVQSTPLQYLGLLLYVVAEAFIFVPMLYIAVVYSSPEVLPNAAIMTGMLFAGLTAAAFLTRIDFSFLRGILTIGGFLAIGLIVCSVIFGFTLGLIFSFAMVALAAAAILYDTSKIIHTFDPNRPVAAALELFASVALLFWYVLRIMMSLSRR